jgi:hypothetical protein
MLREIGNIKQYPGQFFRRWFSDEMLDLFVWYDTDGRIAGFQLCFDKDGRERALTYSDENGYTLNEVEADGSAWDMSSPVLAVPDTEFPRVRLLAQLGERGELLDTHLREYLSEKLEACGAALDVPDRNPEPTS